MYNQGRETQVIWLCSRPVFLDVARSVWLFAGRISVCTLRYLPKQWCR